MPEGAIYVGRPSRWGNLARVGEVVEGAAFGTTISAATAVALFRDELLNWNHDTRTRWLAPLRGHDLACWCPLCEDHADGLPLGVECAKCQPCHADVLLELANG